jgi:hypothetical protein
MYNNFSSIPIVVNSETFFIKIRYNNIMEKVNVILKSLNIILLNKEHKIIINQTNLGSKSIELFFNYSTSEINKITEILSNIKDDEFDFIIDIPNQQLNEQGLISPYNGINIIFQEKLFNS